MGFKMYNDKLVRQASTITDQITGSMPKIPSGMMEMFGMGSMDEMMAPLKNKMDDAVKHAVIPKKVITASTIAAALLGAGALGLGGARIGEIIANMRRTPSERLVMDDWERRNAEG
jgi:hypothetical protein